ncbi:MAG: hypothetical protein ACXADW_21085 [Candidatus Hodarchaeales archaeon]
MNEEKLINATVINDIIRVVIGNQVIDIPKRKPKEKKQSFFDVGRIEDFFTGGTSSYRSERKKGKGRKR